MKDSRVKRREYRRSAPWRERWNTWRIINRHRLWNRYADARAVLAGFCNHKPRRHGTIPGKGGGYLHWRCALRRGHYGMHRGINYVWDDDGRTEYVPVPPGKTIPQQPWERTMTPTRRQDRAKDRWHDEQAAKRRREREPSRG